MLKLNIIIINMARISSQNLLLLAALCGTIAGQTCPDNPHKVASLPNWSAGQTFPCMYAGTVETTRQYP